MKYRLSGPAREDLWEIWDYLVVGIGRVGTVLREGAEDHEKDR